LNTYIDEPPRLPLLLRLGIFFAERKTGKRLLPARLLGWYPRAALGAGVMEGMVAHAEGKATSRLLKLIRMQISIQSSCPFCIDMNSSEYSDFQITKPEIEALQGLRSVEGTESFSTDEKAALSYAVALTSTPISIDVELLHRMKEVFNEREFVVIVSTAAQVNFWTRMIQGIGIPPAGFTEHCSVLHLDRYSTLKE